MSAGIVKNVVEFAVSVSSGVVVTNAIRATTPEVLTKWGRAGVLIGSVTLSNMVGDVAGKYAVGKVDDLSKQIKETQILISETSSKFREMKEDQKDAAKAYAKDKDEEDKA